MESKRVYRYLPTLGNAYNTGWKVMADNFLRLLLVVLVVFAVTSPFLGSGKFNFTPDLSGHLSKPYSMFAWGALGMLVAFFMLVMLLYGLLVVPVFDYGGKMMFVQAGRKITPEFELLISGFRKNYLNIVLSNLLMTALVGIGLLFLLIPGIIMACRLVFMPYLVMDRQLDPIRAAEESWRLTRGHGWRIFAMGIVSFFIFIAGFICLIRGVVVSSIWTKAAFATLYNSVLNEKGMWQADPMTAADAGLPGDTPAMA